MGRGLVRLWSVVAAAALASCALPGTCRFGERRDTQLSEETSALPGGGMIFATVIAPACRRTRLSRALYGSKEPVRPLHRAKPAQPADGADRPSP